MGWRLRIKHVTGFTYAGTAQASYNEARLTPLTMGSADGLPSQTTLFSHVETAPSTSTHRYWDYWGSQVTAFDLQRPHQQLKVTATSLVETNEAPPEPEGCGWDELRSDSTVDKFVEMLAATPLTTIEPGLVAQAAQAVGDLTPMEVAVALSAFVRGNVEYMPGSTGVKTGAQEAWDLRKGVCQDIAHLTVAMLRGVGIPVRYVSGYLYPKAGAEIGETVEGQSHAWVEWWVGQWYGFDPTNGVPAGQRHVVVARGRDYADVSPLKGVYHGSPSAHLGVSVEITRLA
jgi:transglutaminase-like putative cysteine protease